MSDAIRRAVEVLAPGGVVEVRALAESAVHSGYFDDRTELAGRAAVLDADPEVAGIYVTLNPVNPALLARRANRIKLRLTKKDATTADTDIVRRRWLPVDIDPVRPSGVSSTTAEHDLALATAEKIAAWLSEQGFPAPVAADSGNGAHLLYRIDLPNDEAATGLVKGCLATLDALFSNEKVTVDTANYNAARIWKLYGTVSRKGDSTPERPHRRAKFLAVPDEIAVVPVERLRHLAGLLPKEEPAAPKKGAGIDLAAWLAGHKIAVRSAKPYRGGTLYVLEDCPFSAAHKDGAFAIQFANGAIFAGCHHQSCGGGRQRWPELRAQFEKPKQKKPRGGELSSPPVPAPEQDEYREKALAVLKEGDPLGFLLDTFHREHVGDAAVAKCLIMSLASQSIANTRGLHVAISGKSGKGKTHACAAMLAQVPEQYRLAGTVSDKALYYNNRLCPGTVFLFDDVSLSDDLQELLKAATANFRERIEHQTVTTDRQLRICTIPERCVWWLAKVENIGDDQVANRMLTVWIDDSAEQDRAVLEHLKVSEARAPGAVAVAEEVHVCRAIWTLLKERLVHVIIPFATRIQFSNAANRRNPGILFDLIKCHALLRCLQREQVPSASGDLCILATREDFKAAADLYASLNGVTGGQETKLTRNEAAALMTVVAMGAPVFTIKQLQQAMGLTYYQTRRIMNGYVNRGTTYAGLLEKCPAVSCVDATVTEDGCGTTVRRREHHYFFDVALYRNWSAGAAVWIDEDGDEDGDDDDGYTMAADVHRMYTAWCHPQKGENGEGSGDTLHNSTKSVSHSTDVHQDRRAQSKQRALSPHTACVCALENGVHVGAKTAFESRISAVPQESPSLGDTTRCTPVHPGTSPLYMVYPTDYIPLPVPKNEPCHVCGSRPTSSVLRGKEQYLCYACLKKAKTPAKVLPLPGLLDHRTFERAGVDLGRCTICDSEKAVYRSREAQANVCEGCYARLVREWNREAGVR